MKKRKTIFIIIVIFIMGSISVYFNNKNGSIYTLNRLIEKVENGNIRGIELSDKELNSIEEMFSFSDHNNLDKPIVKLSKIHTYGNEEQILATFEIFQYSSNNQVKNIYVGHLSFILEKKSLFKWKVLEVKIINNMKKQ
ncbi:hypothetical protein AMS62_19780 [Bacillus sp. FJAT-18019]|nr:hypothetical protein AMS62_19780 [Bacillus sp. FJAT-18019]